MKNLKLPIGIDDFEKLRKNDFYYIDKTGLIKDMLRVIDEEKISLYLTNPKAPCVVKDEKKSYLYLVLPVNISKAA